MARLARPSPGDGHPACSDCYVCRYPCCSDDRGYSRETGQLRQGLQQGLAPDFGTHQLTLAIHTIECFTVEMRRELVNGERSSLSRRDIGLSGLTGREILRVVNDYVGVDSGYLVGFSYSSHQEFYPYYCGLNIDPLQLSDMTTRQRYLHILEHATPADQAKILRGTLVKCPHGSSSWRTPELAAELESWARRIEGAVVSGTALSAITSDVVDRAIADAEVLIRENGATSGIDRIHTSLHGYLLAVCEREGISHDADANIAGLFSLLRQYHPCLQAVGPRSADITRMLRALATIADALNPVRNMASVAHPNPTLLAEDEAWLVINAARTLMQYLGRKFN